MINAASIKDREVINIMDGRKIGIVSDVEIDFEEGKITSLIIPGPGKFISFFGKTSDIVIPWSCIKKVGTDVILVEMDENSDFNDDQK